MSEVRNNESDLINGAAIKKKQIFFLVLTINEFTALQARLQHFGGYFCEKKNFFHKVNRLRANECCLCERNRKKNEVPVALTIGALN